MKRALLSYFGSSFLLHLLWENAQAPLYQGYTSFPQHFWICLKATATGDMFFMVFLYLLLAVMHQDFFWPLEKSAYRHPATWLLPVVIGVLCAMSFELWAVYVTHRWTYAAMPLLPIIGIGLTPVLQMVAVPLMTLGITERASSSMSQ